MKFLTLPPPKKKGERERQTYRQTDRQTDRQTEEQRHNAKALQKPQKRF